MDDLAALRAGGKAALARALADIEIRGDEPATIRLLDQAHRASRAHLIGLTGPPGVGKSSLLAALLPRWRAMGRSVGVIAVDPSSRRTGGALLGDRARLKTDPDDHGVFVRSMAARDRLGGLGPQTHAGVVLMAALFDIVVVETVGVGQSETDIETVADTVIFCIQPGSGDSLQFMKAGIVEIPHICVVTKADMGASAIRAVQDAVGSLSLAADADDGRDIPVLAASASTGAGIDALIAAIDAHRDHLTDPVLRRQARAQRSLIDAVRDRFGRDGLRRIGNRITLGADDAPFAELAAIIAELSGP